MFALVHVTYRAVMNFTALGALDRSAGTNLTPGVVMLLFTVGILLIGRRSFANYGLTLKGVPVRFFAGVIVVLLGLSVARAWCFHYPPLRSLLMTSSLVLGAGVGEEVFFRGYFQSRLNEAFGRPFRWLGVPFGAGLLLSSVLFGFLHTLNPVDYFHGRFDFAWGQGGLTFGSGLLFAWLRESTKSVAAGIVVHSVVDVLAGLPKMIS